MAFKEDDTICYCFHVPLRKIENFCRNKKPRYASQISECLSAGTGCGWCVPLLIKIHEKTCGTKAAWWREPLENPQKSAEPNSAADYENAEQYAAARQDYIQRKKENA